jgi:hypothetical protein
MPMSFKFYIGLSQTLLGEQLSEALAIDQPTMDFLHRCMIRFQFRIFRLQSWLIALNYRAFNEWMIKRSKIVLNDFIQQRLNNQLRNFSLFKNNESGHKTNEAKSLKDCSCGYYQKKHGGEIKTNDIGFLRSKNITISVLRIIVSFSCFFLFIRLL